MAVVCVGWSHLTVRASVFVGSLSVVGVAETCVPGVEACDFVPDKRRVGPARSPENCFTDDGRHDHAPVISHVRTSRGATKGSEAPCPMYAEHWRLMLSINERQILWRGSGSVRGLGKCNHSKKQYEQKNKPFL